MKLKKVMIFIDWYLPGQNAGGPVRTCANMVARLNDEFDFDIVTRNTDLNSKRPYNNVKSDEWNVRSDRSRVYYFSSANLSIKNIQKILEDVNPEVIHLNSLFSYYFTILPIIAVKRSKLPVKVVIGPRGMLSKGALAIKPFKKEVFISLARLKGFFKNVTWHASTPIEEAEIKNAFGDNAHVKIGIDLAPAIKVTRKQRTKIPFEANLFFLGRVSQVKNLLQCLTVLKNLEPEYKVNFDIYGPVEEAEYWNECLKEIEALHPQVSVNYKGQVDNSALSNLLTGYHFLFLLTENENYGHAIVESLVSGCPVIISDRTPWRNLESIHAGWDLSLENNDHILQTLQTAIAMDQEEFNHWSDGAYDKAVEITESKQAVEDNKNLFR